MTTLLVGVGGLLGVMSRWGISRLTLHSEALIWSTVGINIAGSFLLGLLVAEHWFAATCERASGSASSGASRHSRPSRCRSCQADGGDAESGHRLHARVGDRRDRGGGGRLRARPPPRVKSLYVPAPNPGYWLCAFLNAEVDGRHRLLGVGPFRVALGLEARLRQPVLDAVRRGLGLALAQLAALREGLDERVEICRGGDRGRLGNLVGVEARGRARGARRCPARGGARAAASTAATGYSKSAEDQQARDGPCGCAGEGEVPT